MNDDKNTLEKELQGLDQQLNDVESRSSKPEHYNEIKSLKSRRDSLKSKWANLKNASEDKWEEAKEDFIDGVENLKMSFSQFRERYL